MRALALEKKHLGARQEATIDRETGLMHSRFGIAAYQLWEDVGVISDRPEKLKPQDNIERITCGRKEKDWAAKGASKEQVK